MYNNFSIWLKYLLEKCHCMNTLTVPSFYDLTQLARLWYKITVGDKQTFQNLYFFLKCVKIFENFIQENIKYIYENV